MSRPDRYLLTNAAVVTPERVLERASVVVEAGRIVEIVTHGFAAGADVVDLAGARLMPGLVDLHNDALEREINPRPGASFDPAFALLGLDRKLAAAGVTTQFHAVSFAEQDLFSRSLDFALTLGRTIDALRAAPHASLDHHTLYRLDVRTPGAFDAVAAALASAGPVALVSLNDHAPGQGQYRDLANYRRRVTPRAAAATEATLDTVVAEHVARKARTEPLRAATLRQVSALVAGNPAVTVVSHDDDSAARIDEMRAAGSRIAEFPITVEAAERARAVGMLTAMGAPNALRGGSLTGNASTLDLLARDLVDILVADYHAPALLMAVEKIVELRLLDLPAAVRLVTHNPAEAVGLTDRGAIDVGRQADLLIVEQLGGLPVVAATLVGGALRYAGAPFAARLRLPGA